MVVVILQAVQIVHEDARDHAVIDEDLPLRVLDLGEICSSARVSIRNYGFSSCMPESCGGTDNRDIMFTKVRKTLIALAGCCKSPCRSDYLITSERCRALRLA